VREHTGEGNGCTLDRQGRLIMCEGADHRRITRMDKDGAVTTIAERWQGKRFNKPNDVVCRSDGSIFFTDPGLRVPANLREIGFSGVFRIDPAGSVHLATDECEYPNGLAFSPDEKTLYVAVSGVLLARPDGCQGRELASGPDDDRDSLRAMGRNDRGYSVMFRAPE
jgi:gluconolactonase